MRKRFLCSFIIGMIIEFVMNYFFDISRIMSFILMLIILLFCLMFSYIERVNDNNRSINRYVELMNQYVEKMIHNKNEYEMIIHDTKNDLFVIDELLRNKEYERVANEVYQLMYKYTKVSSSHVCTNIYVDSFLSNFIKSHPKLEYDLKINVPEKINIKPVDLSSILLCLLQDELITRNATFKFHMFVNENEVDINVEYPNILKLSVDSEYYLENIIKKYNGKLKIMNNQIKCVMFL